MARHDGQPAGGEVTFDDLEVRATDGTGRDLEHEVVRRRVEAGACLLPEGIGGGASGPVQDEGAHEPTVTALTAAASVAVMSARAVWEERVDRYRAQVGVLETPRDVSLDADDPRHHRDGGLDRLRGRTTLRVT